MTELLWEWFSCRTIVLLSFVTLVGTLKRQEQETGAQMIVSSSTAQQLKQQK